jgi:hypothetical protein
MAGRTARLNIPGLVETEVEPLKNPVTGGPTDYRTSVVLA